MRTCAVVGGGMLGMTVALRLAQDGFAVSLYEADDHLGGLAAPWQLGPVTWDRHYHVILPSDDELLALLRELGLHDAIVWKRAKTNFFIDGSMEPFTTTWDHVRFPALPLHDKLRLAAAVRGAQRRSDWQTLESLSVEDWLRATSGDRVFERVWRPLLRAKLGDAYTRCNASFIWATIQRLYVAGQRNGGACFGYVRGGYHTIVTAFAQALEAAGVRIVLDTPVSAIERASGGRISIRTRRSLATYDRAVVTLPPAIAARICEGLSGEERDRLFGIEYQGVLCASLLLDRALGDAYITNIADESIPFTAAIEMTALVDPASLGGRHLVYLPRYCGQSDPFFVHDDEAIRSAADATLHRLYPSFDPSSVLAFRVSRVSNVLPLPVIGYSGRIPGFRTSLPMLYVATSAQIVNGTLNVNETLELAARAVDCVRNETRAQEAVAHALR